MNLFFLEKLKTEIKPELRRSNQGQFDKRTRKQKKSASIPAKGQLVLDIFQTDSEIIIIAPIARVKEKDLDIYVKNNELIIEGKRDLPEAEKKAKEFFHQECYWGDFSRRIILPEEADSSKIRASLKEGILMLRLPKR